MQDCAYTMVNKYITSAAHLTGKRLISAEEMTNTYRVFNATPEFLKIGSDQNAQVASPTQCGWGSTTHHPKLRSQVGYVTVLITARRITGGAISTV